MLDEILFRSRFQPLKNVLAYDVFNTGFNGWMTLMPNFTEYPDFDVPKTLICKDQWPPPGFHPFSLHLLIPRHLPFTIQ